MPKSSQDLVTPRQDNPPALMASRGAIWLAAACLAGVILVAYGNSFSGPFVFDDGPAILGNPTIRHLSEPGAILSPPRDRGQTVGGRPMVNLSLAFNYALGGNDVHGYHAFNVIVHILGALVLFGIVRRTFSQPALSERFGFAATPLGLTVALLWSVHPLLTESVTYVIQRAESLMGLFYLLTLYCFIRSTKPDGPAPTAGARRCHGWQVLAAIACLLGMATKEVMVSAPLLVLLYDRTFVAGSWKEAWARRKGFYLCLAATWALLGWLVLGTQNRGGTAGLGMGDPVWTYALTQTRAVVLYLRLALWPRPLVFDYGTDTIVNFGDALPFALGIILLLAGVAVALWRRTAAGFIGAWFFAILAPSSSFVPIAVQPVAEHRMYLPLAAVMALAVGCLYTIWRRACWFVFAAAAVVLAALTVARNEDYGGSGSIWADTVAKRPANARAQCYYADTLAAEGRWTEALVHYDEAIRLDRPAADRGDRSIFCDILVNSGNVLRTLGRSDEAVQHYLAALRLEPDLAAAHFNLGCVYLQEDQRPAAIARFEQALRIDPDFAVAHTSLGSALLLEGRTDGALLHYEAALRLDPSAKAHRDLGIALLYVRKLPEAVRQLTEAVRLDPGFAQAREFLGNALLAQGRTAEAAEQYRRVLQAEPGNERVRHAFESLSGTVH